MLLPSLFDTDGIAESLIAWKSNTSGRIEPPPIFCLVNNLGREVTLCGFSLIGLLGM